MLFAIQHSDLSFSYHFLKMTINYDAQYFSAKDLPSRVKIMIFI